MGADEHALTPNHGVTAQLDIDGNRTEIEVGPDKRIQDFARRTMDKPVDFVVEPVVVV
ncbi:hypothetical protein P608_09845 [Comamonas thiooxydans]|uniref:Uncharacterized protein n=1 Tax=Comamonas thiooxydans TaxID=363952 RepID=A0A0E3BG34_9BURK|nr:hypothetical protein P245_13805 [Comamonas thiooxydans]KGH12933.1 hypothetical protein P608_09845 [Comamonas thiooxydans]KGH24034.1 hypothetical protein P606_10060 [Comamonas thiooxydans]KGH25662.1 hypothetical protein P607_05435 [Comamonas thiooxydans]